MSAGNFQHERLRNYNLYGVVVTATKTVMTGRTADTYAIENPVDVADPAAAFTLTVPDGIQIGQELVIVMSSNSSSVECTVSINYHETSDPEELFLNAADEYIFLIWTGTEWATVSSTASTSTGG